VVTDAQPLSCQDKLHHIKPNRTEPNRTRDSFHDIGGLLLISRSFGNGPRGQWPISKGLFNKGPITGGQSRKGLPNQDCPIKGRPIKDRRIEDTAMQRPFAEQQGPLSVTA